MKVDLIRFSSSLETSKSDSVYNRSDCHKLELCCSQNPAYVSRFLIRSSPWFLIKTRVHTSPRSKQDEKELERELTWCLSLQVWAQVRGPAIGIDVDVDALLVLISSSLCTWSLRTPSTLHVDSTTHAIVGAMCTQHCVVHLIDVQRQPKFARRSPRDQHMLSSDDRWHYTRVLP